MTSNKKFGLTKKHWIGYMCGDWGGCMTFTLMSTIFSIYCTNALGIDPILLGTLVIIWTIWDAVNDPIMGALMDRAFIKKTEPARQIQTMDTARNSATGSNRDRHVDGTHFF